MSTLSSGSAAGSLSLLSVGASNANVIRLNALGKRLTQMANINSREFDFDSEPPEGGSCEKKPAASYSPRPLRAKYHRR